MFLEKMVSTVAEGVPLLWEHKVGPAGACQAQVQAHFKRSLGMWGPKACKRLPYIYFFLIFPVTDISIQTPTSLGSCYWAPPKIPVNHLTIKSNPGTAQISSFLHKLFILPLPTQSPL